MTEPSTILRSKMCIRDRFIPDGYDKTFAQMSTEEKNEVSHRARAVRKLAAYLHSAGK